MFLVLSVLGNEKCEALVDATLLEEPLKLLLEVKIKRVELEGTRCECARSTGDEVKKKYGIAPEDRCRDRGVSSQTPR